MALFKKKPLAVGEARTKAEARKVEGRLRKKYPGKAPEGGWSIPVRAERRSVPKSGLSSANQGVTSDDYSAVMKMTDSAKRKRKGTK